MQPDYRQKDWVGRLVGLILLLLVLNALANALVAVLVPMLPSLLVMVALFAGGRVWWERRNRW